MNLGVPRDPSLRQLRSFALVSTSPDIPFPGGFVVDYELPGGNVIIKRYSVGPPTEALARGLMVGRALVEQLRLQEDDDTSLLQG